MMKLSILAVCSAAFTAAAGAQDARPIPIGTTGAELRTDDATGAAISRDGGRSWAPVPMPAPRIRWRDRSFDLRDGDEALSPLLKAPSGALQFVQFVTDVQPEYRLALESLGAELGHYVPNSALLARMSPAVTNLVRELPFVRAVGPVHPGHKLDPVVAAALLNGAAPVARYNVMMFDKRRDEPRCSRASTRSMPVWTSPPTAASWSRRR
jgi:hypothetical protein